MEATQWAQGTLAYAFRFTLAVRFGLLVSAEGQTEKGGTESPVGWNGSGLRPRLEAPSPGAVVPMQTGGTESRLLHT